MEPGCAAGLLLLLSMGKSLAARLLPRDAPTSQLLTNAPGYLDEEGRT